jgi:hypothetical protein
MNSPLLDSHFNLLYGDNLSLRIGTDSYKPAVKVYDLFPEVGIMRGFGVQKQDRDSLIQVLKFRDLIAQDGLYLLFRQMSVNYVGITQKIEQRLTSHTYQKREQNDWDRVIAFYSIRRNLNPNITGFVERKLYDILTGRGFKLLQKRPDERFLNHDDNIVMRFAISDIERILMLLDMAQPVNDPSNVVTTTLQDEKIGEKVKEQSKSTQVPPSSIEIELTLYGANAKGKYSEFGLEVYAGSTGNAHVKPHMQSNKFYWKTRKELIESRVIEIIEGERIRFLQSYTFTSPTAAAQILAGSNAPGPKCWKTVSGNIPLRDLIKQY